jgi:hypothetical protein
MTRFSTRMVSALLGALATASLATGCGGGSSPDDNVQHPLVRQFSPTMSPIDLNSGQANPTFTDGNLTVSTDPAYPGKIVIFFNAGTQIDPASVFLPGDPARPLDPSSVQILRYIPGTGDVALPAAPNGIQVLADRIIFTPASLPLPDGQYSIGVFGNLRSTDGDAVDQFPIFHSFTVGATDTISPEIVTTTPANGASGVGAGVAAPAPQPGTSGVADVRTIIFGPTSPDIVIRFNESIAAASVAPNTVNVVDAGAFVPGGGAPPAVPFAPGFPKLKSQLQLSSLPSNGFEVVWRADPAFGGLPFGTTVKVTVIGQAEAFTDVNGNGAWEAGEPFDDANGNGAYDLNANASPIADRSGNPLLVSYNFQFQTIAPPDLPENSEPEYTVYWSAGDRFGVLDTINQREIALTFLGIQTTPIARNSVPNRTDKIATKTTLGLQFQPDEISVDNRTDFLSCHTFAYVQSFNSSEVVIINTRTSMPVAIIKTDNPGGISNQTGGGQAAEILCVTNSSRGTFRVFSVGNITVGRQFLDGPIFINQVNNTGNTPKAISVSLSPTGAINRDGPNFGGPGVPLIMYTEFTDGNVVTANLGSTEEIRSFPLGNLSVPNDIVMTPCYGPPAIPPIMYAAISQAGDGPNDGKVSYYLAGPNCTTGASNAQRPDNLVGDLTGFDTPAGLDNIFPFSPAAHFAMAEGGATKNQVVTLTILNGTLGTPAVLREFQTGSNPTSIAHVPSWLNPLVGGSICQIGTPGCPTKPVIYTPPPCWYEKQTEQYPFNIDLSNAPSIPLYVCVKGASRIEVINHSTGARDLFSPILIPGIQRVGTTCSQ